MPIETEIPIEIDDYQKKVVFGLTLRQLLCAAAAIVCAFAVYFLCTHILGLSVDAAGWFIIPAVMPTLAAGFIRPNQQPLEKYLYLRLRQFLWPNRLCYTAEIADTQNKHLKRTMQRRPLYHGKDSLAWAAECTCFFRRDRGRKRKRKATKQRIKAAQKECHQATARAKSAA